MLEPLKVSEGNIKIGKVPSISLPPGTSCVPNVPCLTGGCYALKAFNQYPAVSAAWESNLHLYNISPKDFFSNLVNYVWRKRPPLFRLFVGGDFPDEGFLDNIKQVCGLCPDTTFLAFTKRYHYDYFGLPRNLKVVLSTWPGYRLPDVEYLPWSWIEGDPRIPSDAYYVRCPGGCDDCGHKCWNFIDKEVHVVFPKH